MAKRAKKIVVPEPEPAVVKASGLWVLLANGADALADVGDTERAPEVHIGGVPHVHTHEDADGRWVYAPRDVRSR